MTKLPRWADVVLVPLICLMIAFFFCGILIAAIGQSPVEAITIMVTGSLGSTYAWGYTLYFATNFIFTGLAVSIAFQASLFNIGGEGQATLGGLGVAIALLFVPWPHWSLALLGSVVFSMAFGAAWGLIPAWLQAKRGSHIVITTMMFNFIAYALMNYILVNVLRPTGSMDPATARFDAALNLPKLGEILGLVGIPFSTKTPANISFLIAIALAFGVWVLLWHTRLGYALRAFGKQEKAAVYAGISPVRITIYALLLSGGLSGLMAVNAVHGQAHRLVLNSVEGAGFIGIAVALMGRNHPFGIVIASILFGFLYQGGSQLALGTTIPREVITVLQALVILFTGALPYMVQKPLERLFARKLEAR
jgi:general nucleoside transport system permease protein